MDKAELFKLKNGNLMKAIHRGGADYVPTMVASSCAQVAYTGQKVTDVIGDPAAYIKAMTDVYQVMWCDGNTFAGTLFHDGIENIISPVQNFFGPDGITPEHVQLSYMKEDEYDELAQDPNAFVSEVLLPRKYPRLFEDREYAKETIRKVAENKAYALGALFMGTGQVMQEEYGITTICNFGGVFMNPVDVIFDYFRGFKGSLIDLRRQPEKVKAACASLRKTFNAHTYATPVVEFPYPCHMTHIAPYMKPKQFMEIYWPYEKEWIDYISGGGGKVWIMCEGSWKNVFDAFKEVQKDSCILHLDDDDLAETKKTLGDYQILEGGLKLGSLYIKSEEEVKDEVRKVIDTGAPGEGFLLCTDKAWLSATDMSQNLIKAYNFAHEYSSKH
ncbi:MAG: hypothetical protein J5528_03895 [Firmicutes bacterium]|nr:hypothetical protein [Bacillota bacterium]